MILEPPACKYGYTAEQLDRILSVGLRKRFSDWMYGQTMMLCQGNSGCGGNHGLITYVIDLEHFLAGGDPLD